MALHSHHHIDPKKNIPQKVQNTLKTTKKNIQPTNYLNNSSHPMTPAPNAPFSTAPAAAVRPSGAPAAAGTGQRPRLGARHSTQWVLPKRRKKRSVLRLLSAIYWTFFEFLGGLFWVVLFFVVFLSLGFLVVLCCFMLCFYLFNKVKPLGSIFMLFLF